MPLALAALAPVITSAELQNPPKPHFIGRLAGDYKNCPEGMTSTSCNVAANKYPPLDPHMVLSAANANVSVEAGLTQDQKLAFEHLVARGIMNTRVAKETAHEFSRRYVDGLLTPWAALSNITLDEALEDVFGSKTGCSQTNAGYVGTDVSATKRALVGNIREVLSQMYCTISKGSVPDMIYQEYADKVLQQGVKAVLPSVNEDGTLHPFRAPFYPVKTCSLMYCPPH